MQEQPLDDGMYSTDASYSSDGSYGSPPSGGTVQRGRGEGIKSLRDRLVDEPEDERPQMVMEAARPSAARRAVSSFLKRREQQQAKHAQDEEDIASVFGSDAVAGLRPAKRWPWSR